LREVPKDVKMKLNLVENKNKNNYLINVMMKCCYKCKIEQNLDNFGNLKSSPDGLRYDCKSCRKKYNQENKQRIQEKNKQYYEENKSAILEQSKRYNEIHRDQILTQRREYRQRPEISEHIKQKNKECLETRKEKIKLRRKTDLNFKISEILRSKFNREIKRNKYSKFLGCDIVFLKKWLAYRFNENMNWNNMGSNWHIDHILPISKFDFSNQKDVCICYHWTNLQPLESKDNMSKSNNILLYDYFNNFISIFRFNTTNTDFIGYQAAFESLQWLRIKTSGTVKMPHMILSEMTDETDNPQPSH
jgi:hypothetical protein